MPNQPSYAALLGTRIAEGSLEAFECSRCGQRAFDPVGFDGRNRPLCEPCACPPPTLEELHQALRIPGLRKPEPCELETLKQTRGISVEASRLAIERGLLWTREDKRDGLLYLLTDQKRFNASQRRWDNRPLESIGQKAKNVFGSWSSWPIGLTEASEKAVILLCEGGPDFLTLHEHMVRSGRADLGAVCMVSSSVRIPAGALCFFRNKRVRIFPHQDRAGKWALETWGEQILGVGAKADCYTFQDGDGDLNDHLQRGEPLEEEALCL